MFAGTSISLLVGGAAFVRAEFFSRWNRTFTPRMGTLLLSHSCLLGLWYVSIIASHPLLFNQVVRSLTHTSFRLVPSVAALSASATVRHPINYQSDGSGSKWEDLMKDTGQLRRSQTTSGYLVV